MHRFTTGDYLLRMTKDRTLLITSKRRMLQLKGEAAHTPYLGGLAQTLGSWRYSVNICCLNSGWGSFSKSKSHSSQGTMQAWFSTGEPIHGCGSCLPTSLPTGFSEWGLNHISHAWNSSPHFPKTDITFERENISDSWWDSGKYSGAADGGLGELCEISRYLLWRGLRCHYPMYNVSCILYLLQ